MIMRGLMMRVGGVIVMVLAATAFGDIVSMPLNCSGTYELNTFWEYDFDFGVTFSEISNVYIDWSGEITAGRAIYYTDPCNPFPLEVGIQASLGANPWGRLTEVYGGEVTYPEPEPFDEISKFSLSQTSSWSDLLDGQGRIRVQHTEYKWAPEAGRYIEHGSVTLNDATLMIEGTVVPEPATIFLLGLGLVPILRQRRYNRIKQSG
jgi:hypothetical protein